MRAYLTSQGLENDSPTRTQDRRTALSNGAQTLDDKFYSSEHSKNSKYSSITFQSLAALGLIEEVREWREYHVLVIIVALLRTLHEL